MTKLPSALHAWGLPVAVVNGAGTRGSSSFAPAPVVNHWTATPFRSMSRPLPTLNVLINGHGDLPGPLCNVGLGFDGLCTVIAMGRANHAGRGGWGSFVGNSAAWGIEAEGTGQWTAEQRYIYPILVAALLHLGGRGEDLNCGHSEWAGPRKTDINGWPDGGMRGFRRRVGALLDAGPAASPLHHFSDLRAAIAAQGPDPKPVTTSEEDDMKDDERQWLQDLHKTFGPEGDVLLLLQQTHGRAGAAETVGRQLHDKVDVFMEALATTPAHVRAIADAVVGDGGFFSAIPGFTKQKFPFVTAVMNTSARAWRTEGKVDRLATAVGTLTDLVKAQAAQPAPATADVDAPEAGR